MCSCGSGPLYDRCGVGISTVDDARDVLQVDVAIFLPLLYEKVLYVNMVGARGSLVLINDVDNSLVVNIKFCKLLLFKTKFL